MESNVNKVIYKVIRISFTIMITLLLVYGTMRASYIAYDFGYRVFTETAIDKGQGRLVPIAVRENMSAEELSEILLQKGLIRDKTLFILQYKLSAYADKLQPGTYALRTSMTPKEMIMIMAGEDLEEMSEE